MPAPANPRPLAYVGRAPGAPPRDSNAWFTPAPYVEAARNTLGRLVLDPFSCAAANRIVKATRYLYPERSAFDHSWNVEPEVSVWMNPPYSKDLLPKAVARYREQFGRSFSEGIVLVNNATETQWFAELLAIAEALCFTDHRIAFVSPDGKPVSGNTRGQVFVYSGHDPEAFAHHFSPILRPDHATQKNG